MSSAELLGSRLLHEEDEESLDALLQGLRHASSSDKQSSLGVDALDELLTLFRFPQLPSDARNFEAFPDYGFSNAISYGEIRSTEFEEGRPVSYTTTTGFPGQKRASKPPIVSISTEALQSHSIGLRSALLDYLTAICVLPPHVDGAQLPGKGKIVVHLDSNERFSAIRLSRLLQGIASRFLQSGDFSEPQKATLQALTRDAMKHIHVQRPQSSRQLIATLRALPSYFLCGNEHKSFERSVGLIVLDSADAFYWQDRLESERSIVQQPFPREGDHERVSLRQDIDPSGRFGKQLGSLQRGIAAETVRLLRQLQKKFDCAVIFTTESTSTLGAYPGNSDHRQREFQAAGMQTNRAPVSYPSSNPWHSFPTMPLVVTPLHSVPQYPSMASIDHCLQERRAREAAHGEAKYAIRVDWTKSYEWGPLLKAQIQERERTSTGQAIITLESDGMVSVN